MNKNPNNKIWNQFFLSKNLDDRKRVESFDFNHRFENLSINHDEFYFHVLPGLEFIGNSITVSWGDHLPPLIKIEDGANNEEVFTSSVNRNYVYAGNYSGPGNNRILVDPKYYEWVFGENGIIKVSVKINPESQNSTDWLDVMVSGVQMKKDGSCL